MLLHTGFVLKHYVPKKNMCALLDEKLGRIMGVVVHEPLSAGTILHYTLKQKQQWYLMDHVEIFDMPFLSAQYDMLFLHYMLEMCYHFTHEGDDATRLYNILLFVYNRPLTDKQKRNVLCVLLALIDMYPEDAIYASSYLHALAQKPLQEVIAMKIDRSVEKNISGWLYQCVRIHIDTQQFKTIHFLEEIR